MDYQAGINELTPDEAELLLALLRQFKGGVSFDADKPDEAVETAMLYRAIIEKLKAKARAKAGIE